MYANGRTVKNNKTKNFIRSDAMIIIGRANVPFSLLSIGGCIRKSSSSIRIRDKLFVSRHANSKKVQFQTAQCACLSQ